MASLILTGGWYLHQIILLFAFLPLW